MPAIDRNNVGAVRSQAGRCDHHLQASNDNSRAFNELVLQCTQGLRSTGKVSAECAARLEDVLNILQARGTVRSARTRCAVSVFHDIFFPEGQSDGLVMDQAGDPDDRLDTRGVLAREPRHLLVASRKGWQTQNPVRDMLDTSWQASFGAAFHYAACHSS